MQQNISYSRNNKTDSGNNVDEYSCTTVAENIDEIVAVLSGGDITKRDEIMWGYTYEESIPFLNIKRKEILFIDIACAFFGYEDEELELKAAQAEYAKVLKKAGKPVTKEILATVKPKKRKKHGK